MIAIHDLTKTFGKLKALDSVSVHCRSGECIALIGPNGSGKTTLVKSIMGMVVPDQGQILFDGRSVAGQWAYRRDIGYMPQMGCYPDNMSIAHILDMVRDLRGQDCPVEDSDLVGEFNLKEISGKLVRTLSGGTRQKLSACLAFMFSPKVLILDEPTAGLDPVSVEILKNKIRVEKARGRLVIITSHVLSELDDLVTEVLYMQDGRTLFHKRLEQLRKDTGEERLSKAIAKIMSGKYVLREDV